MMKAAVLMLSFLSMCVFSMKAQDPFIGEIRLFAGNFAPRGWAFCDGQVLSISQNTALFSIIGTTYGGDGQTTFALPDLRGRVPIHIGGSSGQGPGLSQYSLGQSGGAETNVLTVAQLPPHTHEVHAVTTDGNQSVPNGHLPAGTKILDKEYSDATADTVMNSSMIGSTGSGAAVNNMQPYQGLNYIIALTGIFPPRN